jgi:hydroxysqualene synthase
MSVDQHYENFPVASILVPPAMRVHVAAIYRFARYADDVADEGNASNADRLRALSSLSEELHHVWCGHEATTPCANGLRALIAAQIPGVTEQLFQDLLSAFTQDITKNRYATRDELLDYSRRSANPVGRLVLALAGVQTPDALAQSDAICSALQFINFWQDAGVDASRGRIYAPGEAFAQCGATESDFPKHESHRKVIQLLCVESKTMLLSGTPLLATLRGRLRWEIAFTLAGGQRILEKIAVNKFDGTRRPTLRWYDSPRLLYLATMAVLRSKRGATQSHRTS